jgi:hypothetical protein
MIKINLQQGQAMMVATIFFLVISITIIFGLVGPVVRQQKIASTLMATRQSYFLAEAGIEDVVYRLTRGTPVDTTELLSLNDYTTTTETTDTEEGKVVTATGDVRDTIRKVETELILGTGVAFHYGVQVGTGGFTLSNNSGVNGNIYSNGSVVGSNGAYVTGSVVAVENINRLIIGTGTTGDAHAPTVTNSTVRGNLYCQSGSGNNKSCNTSPSNPASQPFPITDEEIADWKEEAEAGGTFFGNKIISGSGNTLGPQKIQGNLTLNNGAELTMTGTLWVTGSLNLSNNSVLEMSDDYGTSDGVIVVDGTTTFSNGSSFSSSGEEGSYFMLLSTNTGANAVTLSNNAGAAIIYAPNGTIQMNNNGGSQQLTAKTISIAPNVVVDYVQGFINATFVSGPSGGYEILDWKEIE